METLLQVQEICKYYRMGEVQITAVDHESSLPIAVSTLALCFSSIT